MQISKIDTIKSAVSITQILDRYGLKPTRAGFVCCLLHHEKTPSMKIYTKSNRWKCFSCGEYGTVIDFVEKMENCDTKTAISYLDDWYSLGLNTELTPEQKRAYAERRRQEKAKQERKKRQEQYENELYDRICTEYRTLSDSVYSEQRNQTEVFRNGGEPDISFVGGLMRLQRLEWFMALISGDDNVLWHYDEYTALYGVDKLPIIRKIWKGEIVV